MRIDVLESFLTNKLVDFYLGQSIFNLTFYSQVVLMNSDFRAISDQILENWWKTNPTQATGNGVHDYDNELERLDPDSRIEVLEGYERFRSKLSVFENMRDQLDSGEVLDLEILKSTLDFEIGMEKEYRRVERDATVYPDICLWSIFLLLARESLPCEQRMESLLARLQQIPRLLDEGKANLVASSNVPAAWTRIGMEVAQSGMGFFSTVMPLHASRVPALTNDLSDASRNAVAALESYSRFLRDEVMPVSDGEYRLGEEMFNFFLKQGYLLPHDCDDLVSIGEECIESTKAALHASANEIDRNKTWGDLVTEIKRETPTAEGLLGYYGKEIERVKRFLMEKDIVTIPDGETLTVEETPLFERSRLPYAAYVIPAPFEEMQEGMFLVTPIDSGLPPEVRQEQLSGHSKASVLLKAIHEGYPGHHLQFLHSNRVDSRVRKVFRSDLFAEGWALYCEEMMFEQGFYDLRSRLFQLKDQLWRACRVVIDVELHRGNMSFQDAVRMLVDVAGLEQVSAVAEVKRYTQSPTQPMSYIMGKLGILDLRDKCCSADGSGFDLKSFHDNILSYGTIPVGLIADQILN